MLEEKHIIKVLKDNNIEGSIISKILLELNYYNGCSCYPSKHEIKIN